MNVFVKCFANLAKADVCDYRKDTLYILPEGAKVKDLIEKLGLSLGQIKLVFVNSLIVSENATLGHEDHVAFAPATGGM